MPLLARTWIATARARSVLGRARRPREELVRRFAAGRSFADIGCMWGVDGAISFLAEENGATAVTMMKGRYGTAMMYDCVTAVTDP